MATLDEIRDAVRQARIEMDCKSEHCAGCAYLIGGVCELEESIYLAAVDY